MSEKKVAHQSRLTLKRNSKISKGGIFSQGLQANSRHFIESEQAESETLQDQKKKIDNNELDHCKNQYNFQYPNFNTQNYNYDQFDRCFHHPSTSSIYLADILTNSSDDYENDLFNEPPNFDHSNFQFQSQNQSVKWKCDDWFDNTANFTQSQRNPSGFIPSYNKFNSQN